MVACKVPLQLLLAVKALAAQGALKLPGVCSVMLDQVGRLVEALATAGELALQRLFARMRAHVNTEGGGSLERLAALCALERFLSRMRSYMLP